MPIVHVVEAMVLGVSGAAAVAGAPLGHGGRGRALRERVPESEEGVEGERGERRSSGKLLWCSVTLREAQAGGREEDTWHPWWRRSGAWPPRPSQRG
jgi:hypothetical protein